MAITGTRSDYGLMGPVYRAIRATRELELDLIVTGMHLLPAFRSSLDIVRDDALGRLHVVDMMLGDDTSGAMARALARAIDAIVPLVNELQPQVMLLQGDRGEMLAGAIVAAHMNVPIVHMSGGDRTGSIDDSIRHAVSKFAHVHLTTCETSTKRLLAMGEERRRIVEVGEPGLDVIRELEPIAPDELARELNLDLAQPILIAALHPVTTEVAAAGTQMSALLDALERLRLQTVFTYPNSDAGGGEMTRVLEERRSQPWLRIVPSMGSRRFLSLMRIAAAMVGNSSSGIFESPSFRIPAVNLGTRQHGRLRAANVLDAGFAVEEIVAGLRHVLTDAEFRARLVTVTNPYGDGHSGPRTADLLRRLRLTPGLVSKWIESSEPLLESQ